MKFPTALFAVGLMASVTHAAPKKWVSGSMIVRPYKASRDAAVLEERLKTLEQQLGQEPHTFLFSMPEGTQLILTIIARHNGVLDRDKSGIFHIKRYSQNGRVRGSLVFTRLFPQPMYDPNRDHAWGISLSNGYYYYGISERTPHDWLPSYTEEENTLTGQSARKDGVLFSFLPEDRKFSLVIKARFAPADGNYKTGYVQRYPLPQSVK